VTQTRERTVESTGAGWPGFASWLVSKQVTLIALLLIAAQVGLNSYVLNRGFFQQDDFAIGGLATQPFSLHLLFQNYYGQLMPGVFALAWIPVHAGGYDWGLWAGSLILLQALAGLALLRALRTLFGNRRLLLIPLGIFLFTPMALADLSWWAVGSQSVPVQLALAMAVDQHVRYIRTGRIRNMVFTALWVLFGLAFFEKAVAIPVLLFALTSAFLVPGSWPQAMLSTLRRHWIAWTTYGAIIVAEIVVYTITLQSSQSQVRVPLASTAVTFSWRLLLNTFVPAAIGGPWRWAPPFGFPKSWTLYAVASPPAGLVVLAWVIAALIVITSLWYRRRAWPAWIILVGWLLLVDVVPILLGRLVNFGTLLSEQTIYLADAAPVLAICLAIAFLPVRGEEDGYRAELPRGRLRSAVVVAAAVLFAASSAWSAIAYRAELHPQNSRSYVATASAALTGAPPDAVIYPGQIPTQMAWSLFGKLSQVQNALAPLANQVDGQRFRWTGSPTGRITHFMIFDAQGRLHPATVAGPHSFPFRHKADCVLTASGMRLQLTANLYPVPLLMQIGYYAARPVTLAVTLGGRHYQVTLGASTLAYAYLPVQGPGNIVDITPVTSDPQICIGTVTIGNVRASATDPPIPASPLPS